MRSMSGVRILALLGGVAAALLVIRATRRNQHPHVEQAHDLSRWEGEGGPSSPAKHADQAVDRSKELTADGTPIVHAMG